TDPRILLVDEVLSVGDRVFRSKCLDKMREFLMKGVAVVFVSHDLGTVNRFCNRVMLLDHGQTLYCVAASQAIALYYDACSQSLTKHDDRASPTATISEIRIMGEPGPPITTAQSGQRIRIAFYVEFTADMRAPSFGLSLLRTDDHLSLFEAS